MTLCLGLHAQTHQNGSDRNHGCSENHEKAKAVKALGVTTINGPHPFIRSSPHAHVQLGIKYTKPNSFLVATQRAVRLMSVLEKEAQLCAAMNIDKSCITTFISSRDVVMVPHIVRVQS